MVNFLFYIILGLVQGILEWLPVSSEGQLVVISLWFNDSTVDDALTLAFWLHMGTMFAVIVYYFEDWKQIINLKNPDFNTERRLIVITTIGTAIIGVPIKLLIFDAVDWTNLSNIFMIIIGLSLLVTGYLIQYSRKTAGIKSLDDLSNREMFFVGLAQGLTIIPGISRSGTTTSALLLMRTDPENSFRGSFLISVPAVIGAITLDILSALLDGESLLGGLNYGGIFVAIVVAFIFGLLTIKVLFDLVKRYNFSIIAYVLGIFIIVISLIVLIL